MVCIQGNGMHCRKFGNVMEKNMMEVQYRQVCRAKRCFKSSSGTFGLHLVQNKRRKETVRCSLMVNLSWSTEVFPAEMFQSNDLMSRTGK